MGGAVEAVTRHQPPPALAHGGFDDGVDLLVGNALADGHVAFHAAQIGRNGVARVEREEFALDVGDQVVGRIHAGDFGHGALECGALDIPFEETFDDHVDRVFALDGRYDAVHRTVGEADVLLAVGLPGGVEVRQHGGFELRSGADAVFAGDDVERLLDALFPAGLDARGDGSCDAGQDRKADGRGDDLRFGDLLREFGTPRIHGRNVGDAHLLAYGVHDLHRVALVPVDPVHDLFVHIGEHHMVARLFQHGADESASDVARSELNSFFHSIYD